MPLLSRGLDPRDATGAAPSSTQRAINAPLLMLVTPASVLVLLLTCIALRRAIRRRRAALGEPSLQRWPWSWLSACVENRHVSSVHDHDGWRPREARASSPPHPCSQATSAPRRAASTGLPQMRESAGAREAGSAAKVPFVDMHRSSRAEEGEEGRKDPESHRGAELVVPSKQVLFEGFDYDFETDDGIRHGANPDARRSNGQPRPSISREDEI